MTSVAVPTAPARAVSATALRAPAAAGALSAGVLLCVLAATMGEAGNAERFALPKEIVLHLAAGAAAALLLAGARRFRVDRLDALLAAFAALGIASAWFAANSGYALRALGITLSGVAVFWAARALAEDDPGRAAALTRAVALAAAVVAVSALLDAYGVTALSPEGRGPGGVFGNRNRMAHFVALGLPLLALHAARARGGMRLAGWTLALAAAASALTLSRSRAAWLAVGVALVVAAAAALPHRRRLRGGGHGRRAALLAGALAAGIATAVLLPNALRWRSPTPYRDSLRGLVDVRSGSGRTRVIQYGATVRMAAAHPVLGVGPGNWTIRYPRFTRGPDPSFEPRARVPTNRLPHGDWLGLAAERGLPATAALLAALLLAAAAALRRLARAADGGEDAAVDVSGALALLATLTTVLVAGTFDPVLLTAAPAFALFLAMGALLPRDGRSPARALAAPARTLALVAVLFLVTRLVVDLGRQTWAYSLYDARSGAGALERAVRMSPGDYRARMLLAEARAREGRCDRATPHAVAAFELFPTAPAPVRLLAHCNPGVLGRGGAAGAPAAAPSLPPLAPAGPRRPGS